MKKLTLTASILLVSILFLPLVNAGTVSVIDQYATANQDNTGSLTGVHPSSDGKVSMIYQSFNATADTYLYKAAIYLQKTGSPAGYLRAAVYADGGTYGTNSAPTGVAHEVSTNALSMATLTTSLALYNFTFTSTTQLLEGVKYVLTVYAQNATTLDATTNYVKGGLDASSPSHAGNRGYWNNAAFTSDATKDYCFIIYGEEEEATPTATPAATTYMAPSTPGQNIMSTLIVAVCVIGAVLLAVLTIASKIKPIL